MNKPTKALLLAVLCSPLALTGCPDDAEKEAPPGATTEPAGEEEADADDDDVPAPTPAALKAEAEKEINSDNADSVADALEKEIEAELEE